MKIHEKYLKEEKLNEGYNPDIELGRLKKDIIDWFNEQEEIATDENYKKSQIKMIVDARKNVESGFDGILKRIKLVGKMMKLF